MSDADFSRTAGVPGTRTPGTPAPGAVSRRALLTGSAALSAGLVAAACTAGNSPSTTPTAPSDTGPVPFHGAHQAGIATTPQDRLVFAAYDLTAPAGTAAGTSVLASLLDTWTAAAQRMTAGKEVAGPVSLTAPVPDTGEALGLPASRLTLTVGFGAGIFDDRFGLQNKRPAALVDLPAFPGDDLDPSISGGDICIQACADDPQVAFHAVHNLTRLALGTATLRYFQLGFSRTSVSGALDEITPRNLMGFHDGTDNIDTGDERTMGRFVWAGDESDQDWMRGGTYLVARRIRIHLEQWDRATLDQQQSAVGRYKVSGAPLGEKAARDPMDLEAIGPGGEPVIPLSAHIRLAAPTSNGGQQILRRGYSFAGGVDPVTGEMDAGLYFVCFQKDPRRQFVPIQTNLSQSDAMSRYLLHTSSAVFACPPGVEAGGRWGDTLL